MDHRRGSFLRSTGHACAVLLALTVWLGLSARLVPLAYAATFTVDRTADVVDESPGSGMCQNDPSVECTTNADCTNAEGAGHCNLCDTGRTAPPTSTTPECTLRAAIQEASARPPDEASTINVPAGAYVLSQESTCTYKSQGNPNFFTSSQVLLCVGKNNVTIQGAGAATTVIDGDQRGRVLFVGASAVVEIRGVTITNGLGDRSLGDLSLVAIPNGGGINNHGTLTLTESVVSHNTMPPGTATHGAGIYNEVDASLTLVRSTVTNNVAPSNAGAGGSTPRRGAP